MSKLFLLLFVLVVYAEHWAVKFDPNSGQSVEQFAKEHSLTFVDTVAGDIHIFQGEASPTRLVNNDKVLWARKQIARKRYTRKINDPLYPSQWHLHRIKAQEAWAQGITGKGVIIAIVDDGLEHKHPDLKANFLEAHSWDFNEGHRTDPTPSSNSGHGTSAAGVAAAAQNNGHCGSGVAPGAKLAGLRLIAKAVYDFTEAQALSYHKNAIKIYSCSWGPFDGGVDLAGPGPVTRQVFRNGFLSGSIFVWAGGNGRQAKDNANYDGYANSVYTIAIGAVNDIDRQSYYSESGACLFAVTPSSGDGRGVVTTDLMGNAGYSAGECTMRFGGTSSATPLAAGIMALILQKHPGLNARQIQHVIASGAVKVDKDDPDWSKPNVRGYTHSHKYGFGLMSIPELLNVTPPTTLPTWKTLTSYTGSIRQMLPKELDVGFEGELDFVEQIEVAVSFYANNRGDITVSLIKGETESRLMEKHNDRHRGLTTWHFTTVRHWGDALRHGEKVQVRIGAPRGIGAQLRGVKVTVYGY